LDNIFLQAVVNGLLIGAFYSLIGMGLNCIFGVMKIINFCQGELLMVGMYCALFLHRLFGIDPYLGIPIISVLLFLFGMLIQNTCVTPILRKPSESKTNLLFLTVGIGMLLQNLALIFFSADFHSVKTSYSDSIINIDQLIVSVPKLVSFAFCIVITIVLFTFFQYTRIGKQIRATSQNPIGAKLVGINTEVIYMITYGLGACVAGIAGALLLPFYYVFPTVGATYSMRAYAVVVLGGLGNIKAAFVAGLLLGILETLGSLLFGASVKDSVVFISFILVLIFRQKLQERQAR
jgi:branched-chain amino acid transport system permease protein